jgi:hypothetical protein
MIKKSIIINQKYHKDLRQLSQALNLPLGTLVEHMILYFKKTGIDPKDASNKNPSVMVKALDKRIVSFLKVQERDILKPMRNEVYLYSKEQQEKIENLTLSLKELLDKMNGADKDRTQLVQQELIKQQNSILAIAQNLDPKNRSGLTNQIKDIFK